MLRRTFLAVSALALALPGLAFAEGAQRFTAQSYAAAKASGQPVLVDVVASWCPTCKVQGAVISDLKRQARFKNLIVLQVDFDSQKDVLRALRANRQSTLIAIKGETETARAVGITDPAAIEALVASAL
jgi:thioredoxin 1